MLLLPHSSAILYTLILLLFTTFFVSNSLFRVKLILLMSGNIYTYTVKLTHINTETYAHTCAHTHVRTCTYTRNYIYITFLIVIMQWQHYARNLYILNFLFISQNFGLSNVCYCNILNFLLASILRNVTIYPVRLSYQKIICWNANSCLLSLDCIRRLGVHVIFRYF